MHCRLPFTKFQKLEYNADVACTYFCVDCMEVCVCVCVCACACFPVSVCMSEYVGYIIPHSSEFVMDLVWKIK